MTTPIGNTGISKVVLNIAEHISGNSIEMDYIFPNKPSSQIRELLLKKNSSFYILPSRHGTMLHIYLIQMIRILRNGNYDVVHIHANSHTATIELLASKIAGVNCRIVHAHSTSTAFGTWHKLLSKPFEFLLTYGFASSDSAAKFLFNSNNYSVVPLGINTDNYKFSLKKRYYIRQKLNVKDDEILIGHVGEFSQNKNQKFLIHLLSKLSRINKKYKLLLVGKGSKMNENKNLCEILNLNDKVIFYGEVDNVSEIYSAMDYFILPSFTEGFGLALLEAQASNLKCFASNTVPEEVNVSNDVTFFNLEDGPEYLSKIIKNKKLEKLDERVNKQNYSIIKNSNYDSKKSVKEIEKLYFNLYKES